MDKKYLDALRWMAAVSVIIVHAAMECGNEILHYMFIWGVPIFVMISGVLFLDPEKEISIRDLLFKYVGRMIITIIIGGSILNLIDFIIAGQDLTLSIAMESVIGSLIGNTPQHLWYLYMIIGIYMSVPLVRAFLNSADDLLIKYVIGTTFLAISVMPFVKQLFNINIIFYLPITSIYFVYLLLGYALHYKDYLSLVKFIMVS